MMRFGAVAARYHPSPSITTKTRSIAIEAVVRSSAAAPETLGGRARVFSTTTTTGGDRWRRTGGGLGTVRFSSSSSGSGGGGSTEPDDATDNNGGGTEDGDTARDADGGTETETETQTEKDQKSFSETIDRLKHEGADSSSASTSTTTTLLSTFTSTLSQTWNELLDSSRPRDINKKLPSSIHGSKPGSAADDDDEAAEKYGGGTAVMVIDEEENLSAFERIQRRLSEAPIIQEIYSKSGAAQAREKLSHVSEDAREAWETSQNPWVYRVSSVYDTLTAESEHGMTERELRELDPDFSLESWKNDVVEVTLPNLMRLFLEGRIKELKPSLGESVYNRMAAESRVRKKEGVYVDTNVLGIMNAEILDCKPDTSKHGGESPTIVMHFMCQQINCVRKKETGEVVEGGEDDIRAYSYVCAFQRSLDEERGELNWKVVDFMPNGAIAYI